MKTAVDSESNVAAAEQLFGYESLQAGQTFRFSLKAQTNDQALFERVVKALAGTIRLGRSRSAQYGRAKCQPVSISHQPENSVELKQVSILCQSDLALPGITDNGALTPTPEMFGLASGFSWDRSQSFLRVRAYSPYNGKRRTYEPERNVISKGSVITFSAESVLPVELADSVGLYREQGLGQITRLADWLTEVEVVAPGGEPATAAAAQPTDIASQQKHSPLLAWLSQRRTEDLADTDWIATTKKEYQALLKSGRALNGLPAGILVGPSRSQWGVVFSMLRDHRNQPPALIISKLFGETGCCREKTTTTESWGLHAESPSGRSIVSLSEWFESAIKSLSKICEQDEATMLPKFHKTLLAFIEDVRRETKEVSEYVE